MTTLPEVIRRVVEMPRDAHVRALAQVRDLDVVEVAWEDNGRTKNSVWGPCITDMTLEVQGQAMPLIRSPNFSDKTWDVPMDKVTVLVGNEAGEPLHPVSLREYLANLRHYLHTPSAWPKASKDALGLLAEERDEHVLMSAQACFLPVPELGGEVDFNVAAYHYQSRAGNPAVLAIISSVHGTSAQVITNQSVVGTRYQRISFNQDGKACPFVGQLLKEWRVKRGQTENLDAPLTEEEKLHNALLLIQVPLRQQVAETRGGGGGFTFGDGSGGFTFGGGGGPVLEAAWSFGSSGFGSSGPATTKAATLNDVDLMEEESAADDLFGEMEFKAKGTRSAKSPKPSTTRDAIVSVGAPVGDFKELDGCGPKLERDSRFPVRVTVQFYKTTSNGGASAEDMAMIASQFEELRTKTTGAVKSATSLVTDGHTGRPTETDAKDWPVWWPEFYLEKLADLKLDRFGEDHAAVGRKLFKNGRFMYGPSRDAEKKALTRHLAAMDPEGRPRPSWGVFD